MDFGHLVVLFMALHDGIERTRAVPTAEEHEYYTKTTLSMWQYKIFVLHLLLFSWYCISSQKRKVKLFIKLAD